MKALTEVKDPEDRRGLVGWRIIWTSTVFIYFLYGFFKGDLGLPWGPLVGIFIGLVIYGRRWLVHDTRLFTYAQTCWQGSLVLTILHGFLIWHNLRTIQEVIPIIVSVAFCLLGWVVMFYQPRPRIPSL